MNHATSRNIPYVHKRGVILTLAAVATVMSIAGCVLQFFLPLFMLKDSSSRGQASALLQLTPSPVLFITCIICLLFLLYVVFFYKKGGERLWIPILFALITVSLLLNCIPLHALTDKSISASAMAELTEKVVNDEVGLPVFTCTGCETCTDPSLCDSCETCQKERSRVETDIIAVKDGRRAFMESLYEDLSSIPMTGLDGQRIFESYKIKYGDYVVNNKKGLPVFVCNECEDCTNGTKCDSCEVCEEGRKAVAVEVALIKAAREESFETMYEKLLPLITVDGCTYLFSDLSLSVYPSAMYGYVTTFLFTVPIGAAIMALIFLATSIYSFTKGWYKEFVAKLALWLGILYQLACALTWGYISMETWRYLDNGHVPQSNMIGGLMFAWGALLFGTAIILYAAMLYFVYKNDLTVSYDSRLQPLGPWTEDFDADKEIAALDAQVASGTITVAERNAKLKYFFEHGVLDMEQYHHLVEGHK